MINLLKKLLADESGQGMAEYGLILALVAVACIVGFQTLGGGIKDHVSKVGESIKNTSVPATSTPPAN